MRILAVITARGGSKRIPRKNLRQLGACPLIIWTIQAIEGLSNICDTLMTTDDEEIASLAAAYGVMVPWLRPFELSGDAASSVDVCLHALDWYEEAHGHVDGLLLLQPTSPFRRKSTINRGLSCFLRDPRRPVVSVSPARSKLSHCYRIENGITESIPMVKSLHVMEENLKNVYEQNGAMYLIRPKDLRERKTFTPSNMQPLIMNSKWESLDIDTPWDWFIAERIVEYLDQLVKDNV